MTVRVLVGDALSVLRTLPDESVQLVVTSPPYFGLRAYGTDPQVWGGEDHEHEWGEPDQLVVGGKRGDTKVRWQHTGKGESGHERLAPAAFCPCGAWRGELGSEPTPALFIEHLVSIFDEVWRVLRRDGLCFVNLGDSYSGSGKGTPGPGALINHVQRQGFVGGGADARNGMAPVKQTGQTYGIPAKNLLLMPQRFAIAMQERGWVCRSEIVWAKTSAMPESVRDRPTSAWEPIWMFSKSQRYFYDGDAVRQPHQDMNGRVVGGKFVGAGCISRPDYEPNTQGWNQGGMVHRNREYNPLGASLRNVWTLGPSPFADAHFATFVPEIPRRCILAGTSERGCCAACGAPWVRVVERSKGREIEAPKLSALAQTGMSSNGTNGSTLGIGGRGNGAAWAEHGSKATTLGWQPSCSCPPADPVPCVVLDPFGGSGTTGLVADRLGRDAVLVELNPEYAEMARKRIEQDAGTLFGDPVAVDQPEQVSLFGELG